MNDIVIIFNFYVYIVRYKNLAYLYTEVRPFNDLDNNGFKTAEFLLAQEWVY